MGSMRTWGCCGTGMCWDVGHRDLGMWDTERGDWDMEHEGMGTWNMGEWGQGNQGECMLVWDHGGSTGTPVEFWGHAGGTGTEGRVRGYQRGDGDMEGSLTTSGFPWLRWGQRPKAPQRSAVTQSWHQAEGGTPQPPPGAPKPVATVSTRPGGPGNPGPPNTPPSSHPIPTPALLVLPGVGDPLSEPSPSRSLPGGSWHRDPTSKHTPPLKLPSCPHGGTGWKGPDATSHPHPSLMG